MVKKIKMKIRLFLYMLWMQWRHISTHS